MTKVRNRVFISYSHKDERFLKAFRDYLKPWENKGQLDLWSDQRLKPSQDWHQEIHDAIGSTAVAVLLVSPHFFASEYIKEYELPPLLKAREEDEIGLTCLYLRPSGVDDDDCTFEVSLHHGSPLSIKLTKYQGLNQPNETIESRRGHRRGELYVRAADQLKRLYQQHAREGKARPPPTDGRYELTIRLQEMNGQLIRAYLLHPYGKIGEFRLPWNPLRTRLDAWRVRGLAAFEEDQLGQALYETLFGPLGQDQSGKILQKVLARSSAIEPRPILQPVRVRIQTEEPLLADLPWAQTTWEGKRLWESGWTFELTASKGTAQEFPDVQLRAPCPVLVIAPEPSESSDLGSNSHYRAIEELLDRAWPFYRERPQRVRDWLTLERAWQRRNPRIVYYYGPAEGEGAELWLHLEGAGGASDRWSVSALSTLWGTHPPQVLFLNLVDKVPVSTGAALSSLHPKVPFIAVQTASSTDFAMARRAALQWFHALLENGKDIDPVWALHQHGLDGSMAWGDYGRWYIRTANELPRETLAHLLLDRKLQRSLVRNALDELVREQGRRLCCLLAYGAEGNLVELFADQLEQHLRRNAGDVAHVLRMRLRLPPGRSEFDANQVEGQVRRDLNLGPRDSLLEALTRRKPRTPGRARPVLFLDWGVRGGHHEVSISPKALEAWVEFCSRRLLGVQCPTDLHLLSCLALESPNDRHGAIEWVMKTLRGEPRFRDRAFRLELLPPLDEVEASDLADFLDHEGNSSCPDDLIPRMPELILCETRGQFDRTVAQIEQAERTSWYQLYDELVQKWGEPASGTSPGQEDLL